MQSRAPANTGRCTALEANHAVFSPVENLTALAEEAKQTYTRQTARKLCTDAMAPAAGLQLLA